MTHLFSPEAALAHSRRVRNAGLASLGLNPDDVAGVADWTEPQIDKPLVTKRRVYRWSR
jgi:hypothetical protein